MLDFVFVGKYGFRSDLETEWDDPSSRDWNLEDFAAPQIAWVFPTQILTEADWAAMRAEVENEYREAADEEGAVFVWGDISFQHRSGMRDVWTRYLSVRGEVVACIVVQQVKTGVGA